MNGFPVDIVVTAVVSGLLLAAGLYFGRAFSGEDRREQREDRAEWQTERQELARRIQECYDRAQKREDEARRLYETAQQRITELEAEVRELRYKLEIEQSESSEHIGLLTQEIKKLREFKQNHDDGSHRR